MRERPHDERRAFAWLVALVIVGILLLGWLVEFFANLGSYAVSPSQIASSTVQLVQNQQSEREPAVPPQNQ